MPKVKSILERIEVIYESPIFRVLRHDSQIVRDYKEKHKYKNISGMDFIKQSNYNITFHDCLTIADGNVEFAYKIFEEWEAVKIYETLEQYLAYNYQELSPDIIKNE